MSIEHWKMDASFCIIFNFLGFILSAATAYIYEFVHRAKTIEEKCIIHLSVSLAVTEFVIYMNFAFEDPETTGAHFIAAGQVITTAGLSSFLWTLILAFHVKRTFTPKPSTDSKSISNDSELMKKYLLIGYGIPFLVYISYLGGMSKDSREGLMSLTVYVDVAIIIINGVIFFNVSADLLKQIDKADTLLENNDPVKLDLKQVEYRQRFTSGLFQIFVLSWSISLLVNVFMISMWDSDEPCTFILLGPLSLIGLQGIFWFSSMVLFRQQIWKDLGKEYGWTKPDELKKLDKMLGFDSEDGEEVRSNKWDLLAQLHYFTEKKKPVEKETNQLASPKVYSKKETQSMQPAIHHYVGHGVLSEGADHNDATKKLMN